MEIWARNGQEILPKVVTSTSLLGSFTCRKARHGTDGFISPPKEGVLRIFFHPKNLTASAGFEPANLGTKGQHATSRPLKPIRIYEYMNNIIQSAGESHYFKHIKIFSTMRQTKNFKIT
jgi:hypothetical protein